MLLQQTHLMIILLVLLLIGNYDTGDAVVDVDYGDHGEYDE